MKIIRIITLLITIPLLSSISYSSANARDCSDPKGFHQKLMCNKLLSGLGSEKSSDSSATTNSPKKKGSGLGGVWDKIKNFGGKKVGEPG